MPNNRASFRPRGGNRAKLRILRLPLPPLRAQRQQDPALPLPAMQADVLRAPPPHREHVSAVCDRIPSDRHSSGGQLDPDDVKAPRDQGHSMPPHPLRPASTAVAEAPVPLGSRDLSHLPESGSCYSAWPKSSTCQAMTSSCAIRRSQTTGSLHSPPLVPKCLLLRLLVPPDLRRKFTVGQPDARVVGKIVKDR